MAFELRQQELGVAARARGGLQRAPPLVGRKGLPEQHLAAVGARGGLEAAFGLVQLELPEGDCHLAAGEGAGRRLEQTGGAVRVDLID